MDAFGQVMVSNLAEIKGNLLHGSLFNITGLYSHSQPPTGWLDSIYISDCLVFVIKIKTAVKGNKTGFIRPVHICSISYIKVY